MLSIAFLNVTVTTAWSITELHEKRVSIVHSNISLRWGRHKRLPLADHKLEETAAILTRYISRCRETKSIKRWCCPSSHFKRCFESAALLTICQQVLNTKKWNETKVQTENVTRDTKAQREQMLAPTSLNQTAVPHAYLHLRSDLKLSLYLIKHHGMKTYLVLS
jgi:hypothetical protein